MIYRGLLLFIVFEYLRPTSYIPALLVLRLNSLVPLSLALGNIFAPTRVSHSDVVNERNTHVFLGLLFLIGLSILTADVTLYAYTVFTTVIGYLLVYWVISKQVVELYQLKGVFRTLVLVHVVVALLNPAMFTQPDTRHYLASGFFLGDGNDFALSVNVVIPLCLFLLFDAKKIVPRIFWGLTLLFLVLCVVATQSRGGTIALGVVCLFYWFKSDKKALTGMLAIAALMLVLVLAPPAYFQRMNTINTQEGSAQGRIKAWNAGFRMALDHPLLGVGAGHFPVKYGAEYRLTLDTPWQTAHSIYFLILGELGFPGLFLLLYFIISNLVRNATLVKEARARDPDGDGVPTRLLASTSASLLAFATGGAFLSAIYYPHWYVIGGLLVASRAIIQRLDEAKVTVGVAPAPALPSVQGLRVNPAWLARQNSRTGGVSGR
ncbi:MAG TPA: O-antigen ligase family protein [Vicinamibacterales bacterium]|nr:O-antigen ligase family protein [Vicinamibacterales bacterium]